MDTSTGEIDHHWYPITKEGKIVAYKGRQVPLKGFDTVPKGASKGKVDFFGQANMPKTGKKIMITAGEEDLMVAVLDAVNAFNEQAAHLPQAEREGGGGVSPADGGRVGVYVPGGDDDALWHGRNHPP